LIDDYVFFRELVFFRAPDRFFFGTFAPDSRASDKPIATACLRLLTFAPERPLFSLPRFISCTAFFTFRPLALPYFRATAAASRVGYSPPNDRRGIKFLARSEPWVRRFPEQWRAWSKWRPRA